MANLKSPSGTTTRGWGLRGAPDGDGCRPPPAPVNGYSPCSLTLLTKPHIPIGDTTQPLQVSLRFPWGKTGPARPAGAEPHICSWWDSWGACRGCVCVGVSLWGPNRAAAPRLPLRSANNLPGVAAGRAVRGPSSRLRPLRDAARPL